MFSAAHLPLASPLPPPRALPAGGLQGEDPWALAELSSRLEDVSRELRRSVEHEFVLAERSLVARYRAELEAQRAKAEAEARQQQAAVESLQAEKQELARRLELKHKQLKESFLLLQRARRNMSTRFTMEIAIRAWRAEAVAGKDDRLQSLLAGKVYSSRLAGTVLGAWRQRAQLSWKENVIGRERAVADAVRQKFLEQAEVEKGRLVAEAESLKVQLAEEARQRALLQENLKRVFMRGVCALNFEAMTLLSDGTGVEVPPGPPMPVVASFDWAQLGTAMGPTADTVASPMAQAAPQLFPQAQAPQPPQPPQAPEAVAPAVPDGSPSALGPWAAGVPREPRQGDGPRRAPVPLPFVSYTGPPSDPAPAGPLPGHPRGPSKGQRWQAAAAPRPGQPRVEVMTAGG